MSERQGKIRRGADGVVSPFRLWKDVKYAQKVSVVVRCALSRVLR